MLPLSYLNNLQIGVNPKLGGRSSNLRLKTDFLLSRLICHDKDTFLTYGAETVVPPFACQFRKDSKSDFLAVANEDGYISLYNTSNRSLDRAATVFTAHNNAVFDICWLPDKCQLITGAGDHCARLWDMETCEKISTYKRHAASVRSVDVCHQNSAIFATGSRDGTINVWDTRESNSSVNEKPAINICSAHYRKSAVLNSKRHINNDTISTVSSVAFQDCYNLASSGAGDGVVKIWDLRRTYIPSPKYMPSPKYQMKYSESKGISCGCSSLVFDSTYKTLYACTTGSKIYKFNCHSYSENAVTFEGYRCGTYFIKIAISYDGQYLLGGSSDEKAYIWKTSKPGLPVIELPGHLAEVTTVAWSPYDNTKLATCGDDNRVLVWKVVNLEDVNHEEIYAKSAPYSGSSKNVSSSSPDSDLSLISHSSVTENLITNSSASQSASCGINQSAAENSSTTQTKSSAKRSSMGNVQTPNKPAVRVITNFFSPVTPYPSPSCVSPKENQQQSFINCNDSVNVTCKQPVQNQISVEAASQVLTPSNHANKCNISHLPDNNLEKRLSPTDKNSGTASSPGCSLHNKENTESDSSPEALNRINICGQTKRKSNLKFSTPKLKKIHSNNGFKLKGLGKMDKKIVPGKTIMNYFSVIASED